MSGDDKGGKKKRHTVRYSGSHDNWRWDCTCGATASGYDNEYRVRQGALMHKRTHR